MALSGSVADALNTTVNILNVPQVTIQTLNLDRLAANAIDITSNLTLANLVIENQLSVPSMLLTGGTLSIGNTTFESNITQTVGDFVTTGNVTCARLTGTVATAAQPNITSVGTLSSLIVGTSVTAASISAPSITGTLTTAAQPSITSVGTLTSLDVLGTASAASLSGTITTAAQPRITTVGNLTNLLVLGNVGIGGNLAANSIVMGADPDRRLIVSNGTGRLAINQPQHFNFGDPGSIGLEISGNCLIQNHLWVGVGASDGAAGKLKLTSGLASGFDASLEWGTGDMLFRCTDTPAFNRIYLERLRLSRTGPALFTGGNVNLAAATQSYMIAGNAVVTANALGNNIITSNLASVGTLGNLAVTNNVSVGGNLRNNGWALLGNTNSNGNYPPVEDVGMAVAWNFSAGQREMALINQDYLGNGFRFFQRTGAAAHQFICLLSASAPSVFPGVVRRLVPNMALRVGSGTLIASSSDTLVPYGSNDNFQVNAADTGLTNSTSPQGVFTNTSGEARTYLVCYSLGWDPSTAGTVRVAYIAHNTTTNGTLRYAQDVRAPMGSGETTVNMGSAVVRLAANDTIRVMCWQNSGGNLGIGGAASGMNVGFSARIQICLL